MTTTAEAPPHPSRSPTVHRRSLVGAEILRLRRRRGLMITVAMLTLGVFVIVGAIMTVLHAVNPARYGPPGGASKIQGFGVALAELGGIAGILVGASAGSGDLGSGFFRSVVTTGRPRWLLFLARVPATLAVIVSAVVVTYAGICVYAVGLSFGQSEPRISDMVAAGAWVLLYVCVYSMIGLGFSASVGSRSVTVGVLLAVELVGGNLLAGPGALAGVREAFLPVSLIDTVPGSLTQGSNLSNQATWYAAVVIGVWVLGMLGLGMWRTVTRDA